MGGSQSRIESRDGSGHGRYAHSGSFQQPAAPQYPAYPPYGAPPQQGGYAAPYPAYQPAPVATPQPPARGGGASKPRLDRRYSRIDDDFQTVEQVTDALAQAGLESSNLLVGIDFTKSNEWTGKFSYHGRSSVPNPYEQGLSILGQTLSKFDEDNLIPCFGFGDASTHDQDVFCFYPDERPCNGFSEALDRYRELVPHLRLAGPTSFAPIIEMAMTIVEQSGGQYHVPLIIADGQVTRSVDTASGQLSSQEQKTVDAIVRARIYLPSCRSIYEKGSMQDKRWQNSQSTHYNKKMPSPQHQNSMLSKNCDGTFDQAPNNHTVVDIHRIQGSIEGEHGGPPADNNTTTNNNNPNDQESLEDEEPTEFVLKDKELFIIVKAVSILVAAVIVFSLAIFGMVHYSTGYPAINKLQKECILAGLVGFVPFSVITVGVVHSVEGRAKAIDLATTMVIAEITYGLFAVCHAAMVIGKPPWFIVVPLFLVAWSVLVGWLVWRYRRPRGMYVMLKKIFKFKMHGQ